MWKSLPYSGDLQDNTDTEFINVADRERAIGCWRTRSQCTWLTLVSRKPMYLFSYIYQTTNRRKFKLSGMSGMYSKMIPVKFQRKIFRGLGDICKTLVFLENRWLFWNYAIFFTEISQESFLNTFQTSMKVWTSYDLWFGR